MTRRRLDLEIVRRGLAPTRSQAQRLIAEGRVVVTGFPEPTAATLVDGTVPVRVAEDGSRYVSRGGDKLEAALEGFEIDVRAKRCLDVGASTGGFTDCLLGRGASHVTAVDVGYGQLAWRLRRDDRVLVAERTNFRHVDPAEIGGPFDVVVADVSFISLVTLADPLARAGGRDTDWILLVKPQFEVGRSQVGRSGVVIDPRLHAEALRNVVTGLADHGLGAHDVMASPLLGAKGNREFFLRLRPGSSTITDHAIDEVTGL